MKKKSADYNRLLKGIIEIIERYGKPIIIEQHRKPIKKNKKKTKIDIKKVAEGLGAGIITDPKKITEMKKKAYPRRPK